ncbi:hypothetical protein L1987_57885 [Smallanthus sonchifolius]|uniref:Uncharacterized protein n=1 Tax=Smallanthus sonchifolius TaxID=185202 RepID=A0ACB9DES2_9ASTR|nr:hypothetical protein L1987_57885 [Smallanthus sonchifolius]
MIMNTMKLGNLLKSGNKTINTQELPTNKHTQKSNKSRKTRFHSTPSEICYKQILRIYNGGGLEHILQIEHKFCS